MSDSKGAVFPDVKAEGSTPISPGHHKTKGASVIRVSAGRGMPSQFAKATLPHMNAFTGGLWGLSQGKLLDRMRPLLPDMTQITQNLVEPFNRMVVQNMNASLPDIDKLVSTALAPINNRLRDQIASLTSGLPSFSMPTFDFPVVRDLMGGLDVEGLIKQVSDHHLQVIEGLQGSLGPLFDPSVFTGINRALLPANLREHADEIDANDVHEFLEQEGIPLFLVPRGRTALRLLRAHDRSARRQVLSECYTSLMEDCSVVLEHANDESISDVVKFALDGLGAMRAGHTHSAQAMFTVTLDTLISRFYPAQKDRVVVTNRPKGASVPASIDEMDVHEAFVWLPIWNAHETFWVKKGDKVPHYYTRHASVHGASARQFNKRNCIQVLMLLASLIGYANQHPAQLRR